MRVEGWHSQQVEIDLSGKEIIDLAVQVIRERHNLRNVDGIDEAGQMFEIAEYATSHSWTTKEGRGTPTKSQKTALEFIAWLKGKENE